MPDESRLPTTSRVSVKLYRCTRCGHESKHSTNHWGDIYPTCDGCSWKNPMQPQTIMECLEPMPEGFRKPEPWKFVRLRDVADVVVQSTKSLTRREKP